MAMSKKIQNSSTYEVCADDPVVVFKNGGFGLNVGNPRVSQNIMNNLRKMAEIPVATKEKKSVAK